MHSLVVEFRVIRFLWNTTSFNVISHVMCTFLHLSTALIELSICNLKYIMEDFNNCCSLPTSCRRWCLPLVGILLTKNFESSSSVALLCNPASSRVLLHYAPLMPLSKWTRQITSVQPTQWSKLDGDDRTNVHINTADNQPKGSYTSKDQCSPLVLHVHGPLLSFPYPTLPCSELHIALNPTLSPNPLLE